MKFNLSGHGPRVFAKTLRFLGRVSNEIFIDAEKDELVLRATNMTDTSILSIKFDRFFFLSYEKGATDDDNHIKLPTRPLLMILRNVKTTAAIHFAMDSAKDRLMVIFSNPKGYTTQHTIPVLEREDLEKHDPPDQSVSTIVGNAADFTDLLSNLAKGPRELSLNVTQEFLELGNYISHPDKDVQTVRLKYKLNSADFTTYEVLGDHLLVLSLQDFLTVAEFAESSSDALQITFTKNGEPLFASMTTKDERVQVDMVLATVKEEILRREKPKGATTYKELMGSYMEHRRSVNNVGDATRRNLSESEVLFALSPKVSTFGSDAKSRKGSTDSRKLESAEKTPVKRKSTEDPVPPDEPAASTSKKSKTDEIQSQQEMMEVSNILEMFANGELVDDNDELGEQVANIEIQENQEKGGRRRESVLSSEESPQRIPPEHDIAPDLENHPEQSEIFDGLAKFKTRTRSRTTSSEIAGFGLRLHKDQANFGSENITSSDSEQNGNGPSRSQALKSSVKNAKNKYFHNIKTQASLNEGKLICENSDSDENDETL